jgi:hypothetical protein
MSIARRPPSRETPGTGGTVMNARFIVLFVVAVLGLFAFACF